MCDRHIYSVIFWNEDIGQITLDLTDFADIDFFEDHLDRICAQNKVEQPDDSEVPVIYGQFTNWMPMKMMDIRDYCFEINSNEDDVLELLKA